MIIIDNNLLAEFRAAGHCAWCHKRRPTVPHHLFRRGLAGGHRLDTRLTLLPLCSDCHHEHHAGNTPLDCDLLAIAARRCGCLQADLEAAVGVLRRLPRGPGPREIEAASEGLTLAAEGLVWRAIMEAPADAS